MTEEAVSPLELAATPASPAEVGSLTGRTALVVGAGAAPGGWNNGAAIALTYARAGARVVCADLSPDAAARTVAAIEADGGAAEVALVDACSDDAVRGLVGDVLRDHGRIDLLHNNVGVTAMGDPVDLDVEVWRRMLDLNLTSVFLALKHVLPTMRGHGRGAVVTTSSLAAVAHTGLPYSSYYASKAAVNHLTRTVAVDEAPHGIRVNAVMPGVIDSPLIYRQISEQYASTEEMVAARHALPPMRRMGTVWEIAQACRFLACDEAAYITGVCLAVDGGLALRSSSQ